MVPLRFVEEKRAENVVEELGVVLAGPLAVGRPVEFQHLGNHHLKKVSQYFNCQNGGPGLSYW